MFGRNMYMHCTCVHTRLGLLAWETLPAVSVGAVGPSLVVLFLAH